MLVDPDHLMAVVSARQAALRAEAEGESVARGARGRRRPLLSSRLVALARALAAAGRRQRRGRGTGSGTRADTGTELNAPTDAGLVQDEASVAFRFP